MFGQTQPSPDSEEPVTAPAPEISSIKDNSLYEKIGGESSIKAVVEEFYQRLIGDAQLAPVFSGVDMKNLKRHQALFISQALGGPKHYSGRSMFDAHKHLSVTDEQFGKVAGHLKGTLEHLGVAPGDVQTILTTVGSLKKDIVVDAFTRWLRAG